MKSATFEVKIAYWRCEVPPKKHGTVWSADPHTIAKIDILRAYLKAWFRIAGSNRFGDPLLYIDGFAGPGAYLNDQVGSPIAALEVAKDAIYAMGSAWKGGVLHCAMIENNPDRFQVLADNVVPYLKIPNLEIHLLNMPFVNGIENLRKELPQCFARAPLFFFIDPFGPTDVPFSVVAELLKDPFSEVLVYFDADGIARILKSGDHSQADRIIPGLFGSELWKGMLDPRLPHHELVSRTLTVYKQDLRSLPRVKYVFAFEMRKNSYLADYFLVFASQHPRGLERMKEAMKPLDQTGGYQFADGEVGKPRLFRFDDPAVHAGKLLEDFRGRKMSLEEITHYTLNETPFITPSKMLGILEKMGSLEVTPRDPKRRRGSFKPGTIEALYFREEAGHG